MEPACAVLEFPVSTYYAAKKREREPSLREQRGEWLKKEIMRVWEDRKKGRRVYGARKVWRQLRREGIEAARCTVARLMKELGIADLLYLSQRTLLLQPVDERLHRCVSNAFLLREAFQDLAHGRSP